MVTMMIMFSNDGDYGNYWSIPIDDCHSDICCNNVGDRNANDWYKMTKITVILVVIMLKMIKVGDDDGDDRIY